MRWRREETQCCGACVVAPCDRRVSDPSRVFHCSIMPCYDKKLEASRDEFTLPGTKVRGLGWCARALPCPSLAARGTGGAAPTPPSTFSLRTGPLCWEGRRFRRRRQCVERVAAESSVVEADAVCSLCRRGAVCCRCQRWTAASPRWSSTSSWCSTACPTSPTCLLLHLLPSSTPTGRSLRLMAPAARPMERSRSSSSQGRWRASRRCWRQGSRSSSSSASGSGTSGREAGRRQWAWRRCCSATTRQGAWRGCREAVGATWTLSSGAGSHLEVWWCLWCVA